jgi:hydrophobe/amphiphile efflux-3 (HAE3) family protein
MQKFWSVLAVQLGKRAGLVAVIGLLITIGLGLGITQLKFATGQDSYLNKGDKVTVDNHEYQQLFGGQAMITFIKMDDGHHVDELLSVEAQAKFKKFADTVMATHHAISVVTPVTAAQFSDNMVRSESGSPTDSVAGKALLAALGKETPGTPQAAARTADSSTTLARLGAIPLDQRVLSNPEWARFLIYANPAPGSTEAPQQIRKSLSTFFLDNQRAQIIVRLEGNQNIEAEGKVADAVQAAAKELNLANAKTTTFGAPVLLKSINDYLRGGMLQLGGLALAIMVVILLVLFDVKWRLLPLFVILVGIVWAFGLAGWIGIPLTVVTIAGLPVMLGVGIDYAIQMHARVEEEATAGLVEHPIQETARNLGPALLIVTFDAIFAFAALQFAKVPMIRQFGLLLAVGIAMICLCSIFMPLAALGIREYRKPTPAKEFHPGWTGRLVERLGGLPAVMAIPFTLLSIAIFVGGIAVEGKLKLQTDPVEWVNQSSQNIKDFRYIEKEAKAANEMGVFVRTASGSIYDDATVDYVHKFTAKMLADPANHFQTASSMLTPVSYLLEVPGASDIAPRGEDIKRAYEVAPPEIQRILVGDNGKAMNLVFRVGTGSLEDRAVTVDALERLKDMPAGTTLTPSGLAVVGVGLLRNLEANRVELTYAAIAFVFLFLTIRLRSAIRSALSLVPVLVAVGLASLVAWVFHLTLSPMTAVGGPLVIAVCTEFTSLILLRFVEERGRGFAPKAAIDRTALRTGRAFFVSAMTAIVGVAVLSFSSLPLLRDFGRIVAMNVLVALVSALVVLPPMLVWADDDKRGWVSRTLLARHAAGTTIHDPNEAERLMRKGVVVGAAAGPSGGAGSDLPDGPESGSPPSAGPVGSPAPQAARPEIPTLADLPSSTSAVPPPPPPLGSQHDDGPGSAGPPPLPGH